MPPFRLGKRVPRRDARTLQLRKYLTSALPQPPDYVVYERKVSNWPMMGNDQCGDCTVAAAGHMVEDWTANAGASTVIIPDAAILAAYNIVDGGVDQGADMLTVLNYWRSTGIGGHTIDAYAQVDPTNYTEVEQAVELFGAVYLGLALPDFCVTGDMLATEWAVPFGGDAAAPPNPNNGHCVPIVGYGASGLYVVTWGELKWMSWQFLAAYSDEAYAVLSPDWVNALSGQAPPGFDLAQLQADLAAISGSPPAPVPPPTPPPTPNPAGPCLDQIEKGVREFLSGDEKNGLEDISSGISCLIGTLHMNHRDLALAVMRKSAYDVGRRVQDMVQDLARML